jgi:hypothetical protein
MCPNKYRMRGIYQVQPTPSTTEMWKYANKTQYSHKDGTEQLALDLSAHTFYVFCE